MLKIDRESYERLIPPHARIHKDVAHSLCQALGCRFVPINRDKSGYREKLIKLCLEMSPDDPPTEDIFRQNGGVILTGRDSRKNPVVWMFLEGDCYMPVGVFFHELGHVWDPFSEDHYGARKFCLDHGEEAFWQYREAMATGIGLVFAHCCERAKLCPGGAYAGNWSRRGLKTAFLRLW